jgi:hypothetical protein
MGSASGDHHKSIWGDRIGPTGWQRAQNILCVMKVHAVFAPVMAINDQFKLLPEQRMKWVRYPERWSRTNLMKCT